MRRRMLLCMIANVVSAVVIAASALVSGEAELLVALLIPVVGFAMATSTFLIARRDERPAGEPEPDPEPDPESDPEPTEPMFSARPGERVAVRYGTRICIQGDRKSVV